MALGSLVAIALLMWCHNPADQTTKCTVLFYAYDEERKYSVSITSHVFWKLIIQCIAHRYILNIIICVESMSTVICANLNSH
jgi:hypothetical protein